MWQAIVLRESRTIWWALFRIAAASSVGQVGETLGVDAWARREEGRDGPTAPPAGKKGRQLVPAPAAADERGGHAVLPRECEVRRDGSAQQVSTMPIQPVQIALASLITLENKRSRDDVVERAGLSENSRSLPAIHPLRLALAHRRALRAGMRLSRDRASAIKPFAGGRRLRTGHSRNQTPRRNSAIVGEPWIGLRERGLLPRVDRCDRAATSLVVPFRQHLCGKNATSDKATVATSRITACAGSGPRCSPARRSPAAPLSASGTALRPRATASARATAAFRARG
jgi:hypothetical protein